MPKLVMMTQRSAFLRAARGRAVRKDGFVLQARPRGPDEAVPAEVIRMGFTCSKKVGNAVRRNHAKRRLRAAAREILPQVGKPGWDYVLIGRQGATSARPWAALLADLRSALVGLHGDA